jgi:hypothetical protein
MREHARIPSISFRISCLAALFLLAVLNGTAQNPATPGGALRADRVDLPTPINQPPDPNVQMKMKEHQAGFRDYTTVNMQRKKQIADAAAKLLELAANLNAEIERNPAEAHWSDWTSRAGEIEKLAHGVKEKMKLTLSSR